MSNKTILKKFEDLYDYAKKNGMYSSAILLREWVDGGQERSFMPGFSSRALCKCVGMALDGIPKEKRSEISYLDTTQGWNIYRFMWRIDSDF